jgi:hypothetical protein
MGAEPGGMCCDVDPEQNMGVPIVLLVLNKIWVWTFCCDVGPEQNMGVPNVL